MALGDDDRLMAKLSEAPEPFNGLQMSLLDVTKQKPDEVLPRFPGTPRKLAASRRKRQAEEAAAAKKKAQPPVPRINKSTNKRLQAPSPLPSEDSMEAYMASDERWEFQFSYFIA